MINAPAKVVYGIIADYRVGHPSILPKQYFGPIEVLKGGNGAGTQIRFQMMAPGRKDTFIADITEPEPGSLLVESHHLEEKPSAKSATTFRVEPVDDGHKSRVSFATEIQVSNWLEGFLAGTFLRRVYAAELKQLAVVAENNSR